MPIVLFRNGRAWRIDLTLWLNDPHLNLTAWHENLRDTVTAEQRAAILRIKDCRAEGRLPREGHRIT